MSDKSDSFESQQGLDTISDAVTTRGAASDDGPVTTRPSKRPRPSKMPSKTVGKTLSKSAPKSVAVDAPVSKKRVSKAPPAPKAQRVRRAGEAIPPAATSESRVRVDVPPHSVAPETRPSPLAQAQAAETRAEDQISIPPATTEIDASGAHVATSAEPAVQPEAARPVRTAGIADLDVDPRIALRNTPAALAHRAKLQGYVRAAVGVSLVLCLAAVARVTIARFGHHPEQTAHAASAAPPVAPVLPEIPPEPAAETTEGPPVAAEAPKTAAEEKKEALRALEKFKIADAIAAGERSVDLDPADADAWRILGAAYQQAGRLGEARRCFAECAKQAKRGEVRECSFLLQ